MGMASGNDDPFRCRCGRWASSAGRIQCKAQATQEDALCYSCRGGACSLITAADGLADWKNGAHVAIGPVKFEPGEPAVTAGGLADLAGRQITVTAPLDPANLAALTGGDVPPE